MAGHDHPRRSGAREQGIGRRGAVQHAAIEQAPEDVLALPAAIEPVAVLVEVGLQVPWADPMEDVERPALEVGEHDVRPGQPLIDVGACRRVAGKMTITGAPEANVSSPAVGLYDAAGGDRGLRRGAQADGAAAQATVASGSVVKTDGWAGYVGLGGAGYGHLPRDTPTGADIDQWLPWSHIVLSNFKRWTLDIFHGVSPAHLQAYLDEYCYRLNRRGQREDIFRRLLNRCVLYGAPAPYSLLTGT